MQREVLAEVCFRIAMEYEEQRNPDEALVFYQEALKHYDGHERAILSLARLHLVRGELEMAQTQCTTLMRVDPGSQEASMMLADLMLQKSEWEAAIYHFQQLLEKTHQKAMAEEKNKHSELLAKAQEVVCSGAREKVDDARARLPPVRSRLVASRPGCTFVACQSQTCVLVR